MSGTGNVNPGGAVGAKAHADAERFDRYEARRKRRRRRSIILLSLAGVLLAAWIFVAHSPFTRRMIVPRVEAMLNASVEGGETSIGLDGVVTIRNAVIRVPAVRGTAGAVFEVKRLNVRPTWSRILGLGGAGRPLVRDIELVEPLVRLSQSVTDGSMNIASLDLPSPSGGPAALPRISVREGVIELGEHRIDDAGEPRYTPLRRIDVNGTVSPSKDLEKGVYRIAVQQIERSDAPPRPDMPRPRMLDLQGTVSDNGVSITLSGLALKDWPASSVPTRYRDAFERLGLEGEVRRTRLDFDDREGLRAEMELDNVAVNLPIDATEEPIEGPRQPEPPARMRSVNGTIRFLRGSVEAELNGVLEDLPYRVRLKYLGLSEDSPFECDLVCENFRMEEKPQVLRFAPPMVRYRLAQFSNPTGLVTARAFVRRAKPENGRAADVKVNGTLEFNDVTAAYASFPYRFYGIKGFVRFDDTSVDIVSLEGSSPNGGKISATAHISPLTDAAGAHIDVQVKAIPIDDTLEEAMGPRRKLVREIASADQHRRLAERGVFLTPERERVLRERLNEARVRDAATERDDVRLAARREIAEIEESLRTPVFAFRGTGDVSIVVDRKEGAEAIWTELIDVRLGRVGLLPDRFPLPIISEGVRVVIDGETVQVKGGTYRGLNGGDATVSASMIYPTLEEPDIDPMPRAHIEATGVPIDALVTSAVAGSIDRATREDQDAAEGESSIFVRTMLAGLRLGGTLDARTELESDAAGTHVTAEASSSNLVARPTRAGATALVRARAATVRVTDSHVGVEVEGDVPGADGAPGGTLRVGAGVDISRTEPSRWTATVNAEDLDLAQPIQAAVGAFSEDAAARIDALRASLNPAGRASLSATLSGGAGGLNGEVTFEKLHDAAIDALGSRIALSESTGRVMLHPFEQGREDVVHFDHLRAAVVCDSQSAGTLSLDGEMAGIGTSAPDGALMLGVEGARFEHPFVRRLAAERAGAGLRDAVARSQPEGTFDADLRFTSADSGLVLADGTLRPRSLTLTLPSGRAEWPEMSGEIRFRPESGEFHRLAGKGREEQAGTGSPWSFLTEGSWVIPSPGAIAVQADVSLESNGVPSGLRAVLPEELTGAIDEMKFVSGGTIKVPAATVTYNDNGTSEGRRVRVAGNVEFDNVSLEAGAPVTECSGTMDFDARRDTDGPATYDLWGVMKKFRFAGLAMTDGRIRLSGGGESEDVLVPMVSADCYGGRGSGTMSLRRDPDGTRRYDANMKLSGVRFAPVLRDLGASAQAPTEANAPTDPPDPVALDESRGRLDANLSLAGILNDNASRRGRGSGSVGGGSVIELPVLLPLIKFSNLQLPIEERLHLATGAFYLRGDTIVFEDVSVFSDSVRIFGYGTATWPGLDLNLRFNSRAVRRLPVISGLLEGIRDEIVTASVTGNIRDPKVSTSPLSSTSRMLETLFGTPSEQDRLMKQIESRAIRDLDRARTTGGRSGSVAEAPESGTR